ncbi:MAG: hypothetical protein KAR40_06095 [Candidatus Sabulitectum sp.]|nr:hypothetical protein [Candidatus Sabulitectum sp.]
MSATQIADIVVPEIFGPYTQQLTEEKSRLVQSSVLVSNAYLAGLLNGGGSTFHVPSFQDLDASDSTGADNVSSDDIADIQSFEAAESTAHPKNDAVPLKIGTATEIAARLERNQSWSSMDLAMQLAGADPMNAIASRVAYYWTRRLQRIFLATFNGILADNAAAPTGTDTHVQNDLLNDVSNGGVYGATTTIFTAEAFLAAALTMGDSQEDLGIVMVHSVVYNRMQNNNLIDFIPDARGEVNIPTFLGRLVIIDDGMPVSGTSSNVYDTWVFGAGAAQLGTGTAKVPVEVGREQLAGNGAGQEVLTTRRTYSIHPTGHAMIMAAIPGGGPSNVNLAAATSWSRVYSERKMIKFAVLRTTEHA